MYKKILIFALSILSTSCAIYGMESISQDRTKEEQAELNERLCKAIHAQDFGLVEKLLQAGASANARIHPRNDPYYYNPHPHHPHLAGVTP